MANINESLSIFNTSNRDVNASKNLTNTLPSLCISALAASINAAKDACSPGPEDARTAQVPAKIGGCPAARHDLEANGNAADIAEHLQETAECSGRGKPALSSDSFQIIYSDNATVSVRISELNFTTTEQLLNINVCSPPSRNCM